MKLDTFLRTPSYGVVLVDCNATYLLCMSCVCVEDTQHATRRGITIFYNYSRTELIRIYINVSVIFNEFSYGNGQIPHPLL